MPQSLVFILGVALVAFCAWMAFKPNYVFIIHIRNGRATAAKGVVADRFLRDIEAAIAQEPIHEGWIGAVNDRRLGLRLVFPKTWQVGAQQRIRNIWAAMR
jgi:hypothetical protein